MKAHKKRETVPLLSPREKQKLMTYQTRNENSKETYRSATKSVGIAGVSPSNANRDIFSTLNQTSRTIGKQTSKNSGLESSNYYVEETLVTDANA